VAESRDRFIVVLKIITLIVRMNNRENKCATAFLVASILLPLNVVATVTFVDSFPLTMQSTLTRGIAFNANGTKMFVVGGDDNEVNEYTLNTGFDVSTASYSQRLSVAAQDTAPSGIAFNADGTKMFVTGLNDGDVNEYELSTGFDISTASFVDAFGHGTIESPRGVGFNTDGTKMFILGDRAMPFANIR
jgi:DNA-binding beta-propeller fold protein YncE